MTQNRNWGTRYRTPEKHGFGNLRTSAPDERRLLGIEPVGDGEAHISTGVKVRDEEEVLLGGEAPMESHDVGVARDAGLEDSLTVVEAGLVTMDLEWKWSMQKPTSSAGKSKPTQARCRQHGRHILPKDPEPTTFFKTSRVYRESQPEATPRITVFEVHGRKTRNGVCGMSDTESGPSRRRSSGQHLVNLETPFWRFHKTSVVK
ncbi:hypothetical protein FB45DRAFT_878564 [Roridomyces roridus]|uniref:Uncharacterized protein n=1 Tax=Roridomyces roridus TaxID=1738132 RepID=A0AAD7B064_9AGAR|nr:hypothetical protein FB45DRAFT_878564 [Roridomyces roridus]